MPKPSPPALPLGRGADEGFAASWLAATDDDGLADRGNALSKHAVSTRLEQADWNNSTVIRERVVDEITRLKGEEGQDIAIRGSAELVDSPLPHGLIDEHRLMVFPIARGSGKRRFQEGSSLPTFTLVDTKPFATGVGAPTCHPAPGEAA